MNANISAATVYVWNDGKLPIKAEDVLEPMRIILPEPGCVIIDTRVLKTSRPVTKFAKGEVADAKNVLPLSFSILEHGDGAAIQIIYVGEPDAAVTVSGTVVGAGRPRLLKSPTGFDPTPRRSLTGALTLNLGLYGWAFLACLAGFRELKGGRRESGIAATLVGIPIAFVAIYLTRLILVAEAAPRIPTSIWQ